MSARREAAVAGILLHGEIPSYHDEVERAAALARVRPGGAYCYLELDEHPRTSVA